MIRNLVNIYRKLPIKPFQGLFKKMYQKYRLFNKCRIVTVTRDRIRYRLNLNELIDSAIYYESCFEPATTALINKFVKRGMIVLDIGANIGCHTLRMAKLVGETGRVIAIEPMDWAFSKLKYNIGLNNFKNIIVEKIAFSNVDKKRQSVHFRTSWTLDGSKQNNNEEGVNFLTLDSYIKKQQINRVDFIKLDVDGYEYKVLVGAKKTLQKFSPLILIELGKYTLEGVGDSLENLLDLLISLNYSFYSEEKLEKYPNKDSLLDAVPLDSTINILCRHYFNIKTGKI